MRGPVLGAAARRFARAVDAPTRHSAGRADTDTRELVGVAHQLRSVHLDAGPTEEFRDRLRQRLIAVASVQDTAEVPQPRSPLTERITSSRDRTHRRLAFVAGSLTTLVLVGGLAVAESGQALPGDVLYGLKRTTENVQLSLSGSPVSTGREHLNIATTRLAEIRDLIGRSGSAAAGTPFVADGGTLSAHRQSLVLATLADMDLQTRQGSRLLTNSAAKSGLQQPLTELAGWVGKQHSAVQDLQGRVNGAVANRVGQSVTLLDQVSRRAQALQNGPDCTCPAGSDAIGPLPCRTCPPPASHGSSSSSSDDQTGTSASSAPGSTSSSTDRGGVPSTSATTPSTTPSTTRGSAPSHRPTASSSAGTPTPSGAPTAPRSSTSSPPGILPSGILPTDVVPTHGLLPSWLLPSLIPSYLLPIGH